MTELCWKSSMLALILTKCYGLKVAKHAYCLKSSWTLLGQCWRRVNRLVLLYVMKWAAYLHQPPPVSVSLIFIGWSRLITHGSLSPPSSPPHLLFSIFSKIFFKKLCLELRVKLHFKFKMKTLVFMAENVDNLTGKESSSWEVVGNWHWTGQARMVFLCVWLQRG